MGDAAVDGVSDPGEGLIGDGDGGGGAVGLRQVGQKFGDVAGSKDLMDGGEMRRRLLVAEVRSKYAYVGAFPSEELTGTARRSHMKLCFSVDDRSTELTIYIR